MAKNWQNSAEDIPLILLVGEWRYDWYQEACALSLEQLGCRIVRFGYGHHVISEGERTAFSPATLWKRAQFRFQTGPSIWSLNRELLRVAKRERPDVIWLYNAHPFTASTISALRCHLPGAIFCQYSNDDPFSPLAKRSHWRHFRESIPLFDLHFAYRKPTQKDLLANGARRVSLLRSYFVPDEDFPVPTENIDQKFFCDVVFAGHYEDDGRVGCLEAICRAGFKLNLFGGGWDRAYSKLAPDSPLRALYPISAVNGDQYRQALCGAKVALCFLSKLNRDTYTRRNFQIPAVGVAMLTEYTDDLSVLFREDEEVAFFRSCEDLLAKLEVLLRDHSLRRKIAEGGQMRVWTDEHDVQSRMRQWLAEVELCRVEMAGV